MSDLLMQRTASFIGADIRVSLGRTWAPGARRILFIGHNGSKADDERDDMTVSRWISFGRAWGFDGLCAVNLYPFMHTDPGECRRWYARRTVAVVDAMAMNLETIGNEARRAEMVVACWGAIAQDPAVVDATVAACGGRTVHCFGTTATGAPIHVMSRGRMRVPNDAQPIVWRGIAAARAA